MSPRSTSGRSISGQRSAQAETRNVSPAAFEKHLKGIHFPQNKQGIVDCLHKHHATKDILDLANHFEDKDYASVAEIAKEFGRVKRS